MHCHLILQNIKQYFLFPNSTWLYRFVTKIAPGSNIFFNHKLLKVLRTGFTYRKKKLPWFLENVGFFFSSN